jgi:TonB family protein
MQVDTEYYATVEKPAMFQGGDIKAFDAFVKKNIKYPASALKKKQQGTAYLQFGVSPYGNVNYTYILKSSGSKLLDKEAIRVVHDSPKWIPAQNGNTYVGQLLVIPVEFKLPQPKANKQTKK